MEKFYSSDVDIKNLTQSFIEVSTPQMLRDWIRTLMGKVEELTDINIKKDNQITQLEAQIKKLQGLPAKPKFNSSDKTSDLDSDEDDDPDKKMRKK